MRNRDATSAAPRRWWYRLALGATLLGVPAAAQAHGLSPSLLGVSERAPGVATITWKTPLLRLPGVDPNPRLPAGCRVSVPPTTTEDADSVTTRWEVDCGPNGLVGQRIAVTGLGAARTDALLRLELADGRSVETVLRAGEPAFTVPERDHQLEVAHRYARLGFGHILTGYDHLLFIFGLLMLVTSTRALVATITAFTLGHSVTLTLAILDPTRVPTTPVALWIALSIFVLAVELARPPAPTLMRRQPSAVALLVGFLHGLGFAGTLRQVGLPNGAMPLALLSFNIGIELGQAAFVLSVMTLATIGRRLLHRLPAWTQGVPVYALGSLAAFWLIARGLPLVR